MHRQTEIIIIAIKLRLMPCPADKLIHRLEFQIASLEEIVKTNRRHVEETILIHTIPVEKIVAGHRLSNYGSPIDEIHNK